MAARGRGLFSLYIYLKNFKNLLLRNRCTEFNVTWQECCFGDPLPRLFKSWCVKKKKHGLVCCGEGGGGGGVGGGGGGRGVQGYKIYT